MTPSTPSEFAAAVLDELAAVVGALLDTPATVAPAAPGAGPHFLAAVQAEGATGACSVALDEAAATALTAQMLGTEEPPAREAVLDMVREIVSQAAGAVALKPVGRGMRLSVSPVTLAETLSPAAEAQARQLTVAVLPAPMTFAAWGEPVLAVAAPPPAAAAAPRAAGHAQERIDVILDIELPLVVRFGRTELPLKTLMRLGPGSVIDLGRSPDEPVEVVVSNRVVARGEVVIVGGNYGIRILDVISPTERIRSMEV